MKIFVVDDSELDRKILVRALEKSGVADEILQAHDGRMALEVLQAQHQHIGLIFLDWQLPKIDGLEILKRIARDPETATLPVIMLTSANSPEDEEIAKLLNPGLAAFLIKPLDPEKAVAAARSFMKRM
ncbi:MAG TPA: response regulator [Candidatus Omnitrophota bacterium]|nr:response regulator [Candidatus Omnitrophota bacterium]